MKKKLLAILLALGLVLGMPPRTALATEVSDERKAMGGSPVTQSEKIMESEKLPSEDVDVLVEGELFAERPTSGVCGENLTWILDDSGTLTISGTGAMRDYNVVDTQWKPLPSPWNNDKRITSIVVMPGVTSIGYRAFVNCTELKELTLPDSLTRIEADSFYKCSSLENFQLPDNVNYIGGRAFYGCSTLSNIRIPEGVTDIGNQTFADCNSLTDIYIPDSVTIFKCGAFLDCSALEYIAIPDSVKEIEGQVFGGCSSLTYVKIPSGVASIAEELFEDCSNLTGVSIPNTVTNIGKYAFAGCSSLESIVVPHNVVTIESGAFGDCSNLREIVLPDGLTTIKSAFQGCSSLIKIDIPDTVTSMDMNYQFQGCSSLKSFAIPECVSFIQNSFRNCNNLESLYIPVSVKSFGGCDFEGCDKLKDIYYAGTEQDWNNINIFWTSSIPACATIHYNSIKSGSCGNGLTWSLYANILKISGTGAMEDYTSYMDTPWCDEREAITKVVIQDGVTFLGNYSFMALTNLTSVSIADSVGSIGENVFFGCKALTDISLPRNINHIGWGAFQGCGALKHIDIPDGVQTIARSTFHNCETLESVRIPGSVTSIERNAFNLCASLKDVYFWGNQGQWEEATKGNVDSSLRNAKIHFLNGWPTGTLNIYPESGATINLWNDSELEFSVTFRSKVLPGTGKIYLKDYDTDTIILTIYSESTPDRSGNDYFSCEDNNLKIHFSVRDTNHNINCDQKYYFSVDANAIIFADGTVFDGIFDRDSWFFSTEFGLSRNKDYISFINDESSFFSNYAAESSSYPISAASYRSKIQEIIGKSEFNKRTKKQNKFGGACFGISVVTALYKMGMLIPADFDLTAQTLFDMKKPKDNTEPYGVRDLINYYHMLQFTNSYNISGLDTLKANWFRDSNKFTAAVKEIVEKGLDMNTSKTVLVLSLGYMEGLSQHQHAVVLCSARKIRGGGYELLIKDPNKGSLSTMQVSSDYTSLTYINELNKEYDVAIVKTIDVAALPSNWLIRGRSIISREPSDGLVTASMMENAQDFDVLKVVAYGNFTITNSSGKTLLFENGYLSGTMEVLSEDFVESGVEDYAEFVYYVPKSSGYMFQSADSRSSCTVSDGEQYLSVYAENAASITMNKAEGISVQGSNLVYDACATTATGTNMFAVSGETGSNLEISLTSDGSAEITADSMENVVFQSLYDDTSLTFDSSTNTAKVVETDQGSLTLDGVEIHEQTLFSTTLRDAGDCAEATVTNNTTAPQIATVLIAVYQPNGQFVKADIKKLAFEGNQAIKFSLTERDAIFKIFVIDDFDNLSPAGRSAKFCVGE